VCRARGLKDRYRPQWNNFGGGGGGVESKNFPNTSLVVFTLYLQVLGGVERALDHKFVMIGSVPGKGICLTIPRPMMH
jgi:hypothetical protein